MTNPYSLFQTDKNLEAGEGVKLEYPGFSIVIHRAGGDNAKYAKVLAEKLRPHRRKFDQGILDDKIAHRLLVETYAEAVVVGWNGIEVNGEELPYSVENCVKLFLDLPELFKDVQKQADDFANFKAEVEGLEEKN